MDLVKYRNVKHIDYRRALQLGFTRIIKPVA